MIRMDRLALAREHGGPHMWNVVPERIGDLRTLIRDLVGEVDRLRARVAVVDQDVEQSGVTRAHVEAWLRANGWAPTSETGWKCFVDGHSTDTQTWRSTPPDGRGVSIEARHRSEGVADSIRSIAYHFGRAGLDVLGEMAMMSVEAVQS